VYLKCVRVTVAMIAVVGGSVPYEDYNWEQLLMRFLLAAVAILEGIKYV